jgi:hypothetical protein
VVGVTLLAALAVSHLALAAAALPTPVAPCAACVTWHAAPATARLLLVAPGPLDGLEVLVTIRGDDEAAEAAAVARELAARGAVVGLELPLDSGLDMTALASQASRVVFALAAAAHLDDALVFAIRTRATAARAGAPTVTVGLSGPADLLVSLAARAIAPYVSLLVPTSLAPARFRVPEGFERWEPAAPASSIEEALARTARREGDRLLVPLREEDMPVARALARLAGVLPAGLTPLADVSVCAEGVATCVPAVFLHPGTLEAIAVLDGGRWLTVRPGATHAFARSLSGEGEVALAVVARPGRAEIDARATVTPFVMRIGGWAGGAAGFSAAVEVTAGRALTVAEILAAHQAAAARQAARVRSLIATGTTVIAFQVPGLAAPMTVAAGTILYRRGSLAEIEQRDLRLNGVEVAVGADGVPRLPLVQPERVASPPLSITLGEAYRYRLEGEEVRAGVACYVVGFEPTDDERPSFRGRAWITKDVFALARLQATQTGLRGAIVSSRQEDEFQPLEVEGARAWLLVRSDVEQAYEGPAHRTPIHRQIAFDRIEANPGDFDARLAAARASRSVMMRETPDGFRYLRHLAPSERSRRGEDDAAGSAPAESESGRALAGRASRVWSIAAGVLFDPNIDRPLPFAGLSYLDFDVLGTGTQMSAFLAGPFAQVALSVPSVGGAGVQLQAWAFASLARYNDRSFRGGIERYDENLRQRPLRGSVAALCRLGARTRVRAAYDFDAVLLEGNDTTAADFQVPASPVAHALRLGLEWERGQWSATVWGSAARRQRWTQWGRAGDFSPDARGYERAGVSLTRAFVVSPAAVARLEASALAGHDLDRFSRFAFDAFENRLHGYPSAGIRFDRGLVLRSAATWTARPGLRLDAFVDGAVVRDPAAGAGSRGHLGTGVALEAALPGRFLLSVDWGFGFEARDRAGQRGTHVVRVTAYKVL